MTSSAGPLAALAADIIALAAMGDLAAADAVVAGALEDVVDRLDHDGAAFWYAVAALEHHRGDLGAQRLAGDRCLQVAQAIGSPGWASNALSVRGMALARGRDVTGAIADLARAEVELDACDDEGLRNWAHVGLGYSYLHLRLYELAEPHMLAAAELRGAAPMPLQESAVIDRANLSELYLAWADELDRVPGYAEEGEVAAYRARGQSWAREAVREARARGLQEWVSICRVLHLSAVADQHPLLVQPHLRELVTGLGDPGRRTRVACALTRALRLCGDAEQAHAVISLAVAELPGTVVDWQIEVAARDLLVSIDADRGAPGATNALAYVRLLSTSSWQQRLRTLQGVRTAVDVERLQRDGDAARLIARQDPLTGLGNRRALDEALARIGAVPGDRREHSLVLLDLDAFKSVNDDYGHAVGDRVLCAVADALRAHARDGDELVRLGGDEFVVLAVGASPEVGAELVSRFEDGIATTDWELIAPGLRVTATVGCASTATATSEEGQTVGDLVHLADEAMYRHKRRWRSGRPAVRDLDETSA